MTPANVVLEESPDVSVAAPSVIDAAESLALEVAIDATVSLNPAKLKVALSLTTTADELLIRSFAPLSASVPADTVVVPVYVFAPEIESVPVPCLVRPIEAPETVPDITADFVDATFTEDVEARVVSPDNVPLSEK